MHNVVILLKKSRIYIEEVKKEELILIKNYFKKINVIEEKNSVFSLILEDEDILNNLPENIEIFKEIKISYNNFISNPPPMKIGDRVFDFKNKVYVMGILNITPDSFYDGNLYFDHEKAFKRAELMWKEGADIIDIGGESTRPGSVRISEDEELRRVIPVLKRVKSELDVIVSVDTYKSKVAEEAISHGADLINDISGLIADERMGDVVSKYQIPLVIMHIRGNPAIMQINPSYNDVVIDVIRSLRTKISFAKYKGIKEENIIIDPGIGFGKTLENNLDLIIRLKEIKCIGRPILIGLSRKSFIGKILDLPPEERLEGTIAANALAIINSANIIRVHDVKEAKRVARLGEHFLDRINKYFSG